MSYGNIQPPAWGAGAVPSVQPGPVGPQSQAIAAPAPPPPAPAVPMAPHPYMQHFSGMLSHPDGHAQAVAAGWTPPRTMQEAQGFAQRLQQTQVAPAAAAMPRLPNGLPQAPVAAPPSTSAAAPAPPLFGSVPNPIVR